MTTNGGTTRRGLLRGAALAGAGALAATGGSALAQESKEEMAFDHETDVLVVGMGLAGLCTANRALDLGVNVTFIEKLPRGYWVPGGSMIVAGQSVHIGSQSPMLPEEELRALVVKNTSKRAPTPMIDAFVGNAHRAMEWLIEAGAKFEEEAGAEKTLAPKKEAVVNSTQWGLVKPGAVYDATNYGGKVNAEVLLARFEDMGGTTMFETAATKLITDSKGVVIGAEVKAADGTRSTIGAKAVVLCTGGMHYNQEMMTRYCGPHASEILPYGSPGATGDGQEMARAIGAGFRHPGVVGGLRACPEDAVWNMDHYYNNLQAVAYQGILVDEYGNRVFDESVFSEQKMALQTMMKHTESVTGMILVDSAIVEGNEAVFQIIERVKEFDGTVYEADTIEEIQEMALNDENLGLRLGRQMNLASTVKAYNKAIDDGTNMELRPSRGGNLNKIEAAPIYAIPFTPMTILSFGGLLTNEKGEVIDKDGGVIAGLYAVGEVMHNSIGGGPNNTFGHETAYVGNLALCLIFGVIAAESAGDYVGGMA